MKKIYPMKRIAAGCMALCIAFAAFGFSDNSVKDVVMADNDTYSSQLEELKKQQQELDKQIADADKKLADEQDNLEAIKKKYKSIQKKIANSEKYSSELEDQMAELDGKQLDTQHSLDLQETAINEGKDDFMERIRAKGVNIVIFDPSLKTDTFENSKVIRDFNEFCSMSDVIVANRMDAMLSDVKEKVYTRDIYFRD